MLLKKNMNLLLLMIQLKRDNFFYIGDYSQYGDYLNLNVYSEVDHDRRQYEMETYGNGNI
jgi:hypothetical protein